MDCKTMTTPMESNLKLLSVSSSESVDATMYCQMIYLKNTRPYIFFAVNTLRHVHLMVTKHAVRYLKGTVEYGIKCDLLVWQDGVLHGAKYNQGKNVATCCLGERRSDPD